MNHLQSQKIRIRNLPLNLVVTKKIHVKPVGMLWLFIVLGVLVVFMRPYLMVYGLILITLPLFGLIVLPDRKLCDFTPKYLILYNQRNRQECMLIYWDEIVSWAYERHPANDLLVVSLTDESTEVQELYSRSSIRRAMEQYVPHKEVKTRKKRNGVS